MTLQEAKKYREDNKELIGKNHNIINRPISNLVIVPKYNINEFVERYTKQALPYDDMVKDFPAQEYEVRWVIYEYPRFGDLSHGSLERYIKSISSKS